MMYESSIAKKHVGVNPSLRHNHVCSGAKYDEWLKTNAADVKSWTDKIKAFSPQLKRGVLFLGNSHTGEVYEALLDSLADNIKKFEVTEFKNVYYREDHSLPYPDELTLDNYPLVEKIFAVDNTNGLPLANVT